MILTPDSITRFWKKVIISDGCWDWSGEIIHNGYGRLSVNNKHILAHRFSWLLHNGDIPAANSYHGICVLHKCDNRRCTNPNHLFLGEHKDNMLDCKQKKRTRTIVGDKPNGSKLNSCQVKEIRTTGKNGTYESIALKYNVTRHMISKIINRKAWLHLDSEVKGHIDG